MVLFISYVYIYSCNFNIIHAQVPANKTLLYHPSILRR